MSTLPKMSPKSQKSQKSPVPDPRSTCGVCGKPINGNECFAYEGGYRHKQCGPGSKVWTAKHGKSKIGEMLEHHKKPRPVAKKDDPLRQAIKEFCGREKYLRYMATTSHTTFHWELYSEYLGIKQTSAEPPMDPEVLYNQLRGESK